MSHRPMVSWPAAFRHRLGGSLSLPAPSSNTVSELSGLSTSAGTGLASSLPAPRPVRVQGSPAEIHLPLVDEVERCREREDLLAPHWRAGSRRRERGSLTGSDRSG